MTALPRLDAEGVHQHPAPELIETSCGSCSLERCCPVASVTWFDDETRSTQAVTAGLACLPDAVDQANDRGRAVSVLAPTWGTDALVRDAGITLRRADHWVRLGLLSPMDGAGPGTGFAHRYLACEVEHARWLARCSAAGLNLHRAHELLVGSDEDRAMAKALWRRFRDRSAVAA